MDDAIVAAVEEDNPVTLRGVFYRVVSAGAVEKTEMGYRLVGRQLLKLRRSGVIPYADITDGTRWVTKPASWTDLDEMLDAAGSSYRRALWQDQGVDVHVFTEKDAISGVIEPVTARWDVPLAVMRGYASESFAWSMAAEIRSSAKNVHVYQLGDHDPSGLDAWRDFRSKVCGFLGADEEIEDRIRSNAWCGYNEIGFPVTVYFERLAVTPSQIWDLSLPTRPTKRTDSRTRGFVGDSVEVDAIRAPELRRIVTEAIEQHIDKHQLRLTRLAEQSERDLFQRMRNGGGEPWTG